MQGGLALERPMKETERRASEEEKTADAMDENSRLTQAAKRFAELRLGVAPGTPATRRTSKTTTGAAEEGAATPSLPLTLGARDEIGWQSSAGTTWRRQHSAFALGESREPGEPSQESRAQTRRGTGESGPPRPRRFSPQSLLPQWLIRSEADWTNCSPGQMMALGGG